MKKTVLSLFLAVSVLLSVLPAAASTTPSPWAEEEVAMARSKGIVPLSLLLADYQNPITRGEMCELLVTLYSSQSGNYYALDHPESFSDVPESSPGYYSITAAYHLGLVSGVGGGAFQPDRYISRQEAAKMIAQLYALFGESPSADWQVLSAFSDQKSIADWAVYPVAAMVERGIIKGKSDGAFHPTDTITVEESILMVNRMLVGPSPTAITLTSHGQNAVFSSKKDLTVTWDGPDNTDYDVYLVTGGKIRHVTNTSAHSASIPKNLFETRTAYRIVIGNGKAYSEPVTVFADAVDLGLKYSMNKIDTVDFSWTGLQDTDTYTLTLTRTRNTKYAQGRIAPQTETFTVTGKTLSVPRTFHTDYVATLSAGAATETVKFSTGNSPIATNGKDAKEILVYPEGRFETQEDSLLAMADIRIPVWRLKGNNKVSGTATLRVNAKLAPILETIFQEIYNDQEAFPIQDAGGYNWRNVAGTARLSEHAFGTAIDINYMQNYCISFGSGSTTGTHWTPGEDPLSIPAFGSVVRIFEKYGFTWGGDAWSGKADYMHFSYFGT